MTRERQDAIEIRPVTEAEFEAWTDAMHAGFLDHAAEGEAAFRLPYVDLARTLGAFDGDRIVGTFRSFATKLSLVDVHDPNALAVAEAMFSTPIAPWYTTWF